MSLNSPASPEPRAQVCRVQGRRTLCGSEIHTVKRANSVTSTRGMPVRLDAEYPMSRRNQYGGGTHFFDVVGER